MAISSCGEVKDDIAFNVFIEDRDEAYWFAPDLLELINHAVGTEIRIEGVSKRWVRTADGDWEEFQLIQLVCSRDLKHWQRLGDRQTFIGPSRIDSGAYDLTQILPPSAPIVHDDELWFYYTGLKWRSTFKYLGKYPGGVTELIPGRDRDGGAICLAVLNPNLCVVPPSSGVFEMALLDLVSPAAAG